MKKKSTFINSLAFFFLVGLIFSSCTQGSKDVTNDIMEANKGFMEAFNNGDAHAVAINYTTDAKLFPANSDVVEGQEAIETFWNDAMGMGVGKAVLTTVDAKASGNMTVEEGKYQLFTKDGKMIDQGKYVVNWKKVDGAWKLHKDIWNTNVPAPFSSAPDGFPVISEAARYTSALYQLNYFVLNSINYVKSKGQSVENFARFTEDQYKTSWDKTKGYDGFVKGMLYNLSIFMPKGEMKILERDDNHVKFSSGYIYLWLKNNTPQMNVSYDEYLTLLRISTERIADYLGATYTQETTPDGLVFTISKK